MSVLPVTRPEAGRQRPYRSHPIKHPIRSRIRPHDAHRCGQPGQQHGRPRRSLSSEHIISTCCRLVSSFLTGDGPADPLVACEGYVFPCRPCLRVGGERRPEIRTVAIGSPPWMSSLAHDLLKDQASDTRVQLVFWDNRRQSEVDWPAPPISLLPLMHEFGDRPLRPSTRSYFPFRCTHRYAFPGLRQSIAVHEVPGTQLQCSGRL